ncbi:MAG TPA: hypothetical protein VGV59_10755, partial [Pyrinomonadaceae bacterium]|nr:hypothetical protein [Pyrinomonadaceae bacterium]
AKQALSQEKQEKYVEEVLKRTKVKVADEYAVKQPEMPQRPNLQLGDPQGADTTPAPGGAPEGDGGASPSSAEPRGKQQPNKK